MRFFDQYNTWSEAKAAWDQTQKKAEKHHPLKVLKTLPNMPGISPCTKKNLRWKSLRYLIQEDHGKVFRKYIFKHPLRYGIKLLQSYFRKIPFHKKKDFYFYNLRDMKQFHQELKNPDRLFVLGFSYCHKPFECPSGRFTDQCIHDAMHPTCQQCFIGKSIHSLPEQSAKIVIIPTIHYIGKKMFELTEEYPNREILFLITACEMTLTMFADWGNLLGLKGIGVRLDGRICNTMKAFELSEKGIKPGLTVVLDQTQQEILELLRLRRAIFSS